MRRTLLVLTGILACAVLASAGTAAAKPAAKTCTTNSKNVIGHTVTGTLTASNVNSAQAQYATCSQARKIMNQVTGLRIEEPESVVGFSCVPLVTKTRPDVVHYTCTFKGADTPMFVKLTFTVKYDLD
jgi:hypothetical protein